MKECNPEPLWICAASQGNIQTSGTAGA